MAGIYAHVDAQNVATVAENIHGLMEAQVTENKANQQNKTMRGQTIPLNAVDSSGRPLFQDVNIMREHFRTSLAAVQQVEDQLAGMYQRSDDMENRVRSLEKDLQQQQNIANAALDDCSEMAQQLLAVQKTNGEREEELRRLREEYADYKEQAEKRMHEMSNTIRESSARCQRLTEENKDLTGIQADIVAAVAQIQAHNAAKKGEEERGTPECFSERRSRKRKEPEGGSLRPAVTDSAHQRIRLMGESETVPAENPAKTGIRQDKPTQAGKQRGGCLYYCGICQDSQVQGGALRANALVHMLGYRAKEGMKRRTNGPCEQWRNGTIDPQDRQDYLLGKYPRRGLRYVRYRNGLEGEIVEMGYHDWTAEMQRGRGVCVVDRDQAEAEAARAATVHG